MKSYQMELKFLAVKIVLMVLVLATVQPTQGGEFFVRNHCQQKGFTVVNRTPEFDVTNRVPAPVVPTSQPTSTSQWISYDGGQTWQASTAGVSESPTTPIQQFTPQSFQGSTCANGQCGTQSTGTTGFFRRR